MRWAAQSSSRAKSAPTRVVDENAGASLVAIPHIDDARAGVCVKPYRLCRVRDATGAEIRVYGGTNSIRVGRAPRNAVGYPRAG